MRTDTVEGKGEKYWWSAYWLKGKSHMRIVVCLSVRDRKEEWDYQLIIKQCVCLPRFQMARGSAAQHRKKGITSPHKHVTTPYKLNFFFFFFKCWSNQMFVTLIWRKPHCHSCISFKATFDLFLCNDMMIPNYIYKMYTKLKLMLSNKTTAPCSFCCH